MGISRPEAYLAELFALQPEAAVWFKADLADVLTKPSPLFEHQGEGRAVASLPTQHHQASTGFGRGPLALAHAHPVAESIDIALLASLGGASLGPGYRLAVDQFNP